MCAAPAPKTASAPAPNRPLKLPRSGPPILWIVAGPNGSGKSTLYTLTDLAGWDGSVWIINPDLLTVDIRDREAAEPVAANLAAVQRIETWLAASLDVYQTIGVETVLSSPKYRTMVERAQARGFEVRMIYVLLQSAALQIERVRIRVANGGHDVPEAKIRSRRTRSFAQLAWFAQHVDQLVVFDNSSGEPALMATGSKGPTLSWHRTPGGGLRAELVEAGLGEGLPPLPGRERRPKVAVPVVKRRARRRARKAGPAAKIADE